MDTGKIDDIGSDELPEYVKKAPFYTADPRAAARALRPIIEAGADEAERLGRIPDNVVRAIADTGLWGMLVPRELGGTEVDPATYIDVIEELSYADGSVGWVMMASTFGTSGAAIWLGPSAIDAMYKQGNGYICAGQIAPTGKAERVDGGYRVSGKFQFGSGAQVAAYMFGCFVLQKDGKPELSPEGKIQTVWGFAPRNKLRLHKDSWDVLGLTATASYDYEFPEQFIADDFIMFPFQRARRGGPFYEIAVSIAHVSWALGVGMRILDEIKALASRKRRQGRTTLIDQPTFQRDFAKACGDMEASRAYVRSVFQNWYEAAKTGKPAIDVRVQGRLAACWATEVAANVGRFAYLAAGSDGLRNAGGTNRLQRCFRDLQAGAIHKHVDHNVLIECGQVLLGVNPPGIEI